MIRSMLTKSDNAKMEKVDVQIEGGGFYHSACASLSLSHALLLSSGTMRYPIRQVQAVLLTISSLEAVKWHDSEH